MISFKKSYAEQLIQLAIALSLLRVDPENYLGLGWESQLASLHDGGDGWQLELRAAPLTDYPYANRKAVMPLIEDLARFRETINPYDVTAYLLNVQNGSNGGSIGGGGGGVGNNQTTTTSATSPPNLLANDHAETIIDTQRNQTQFESSLIYTNEQLHDEMFLNSDLFEELPSILDQNLADLNDYGEMPFTSFNNLPLKDEPPELPLSEFEIRRNRASTSFSSSGIGSIGSPESNYSASAVIDWTDYFDVKDEPNDGIDPMAGEEEEDEEEDQKENEEILETEFKVKQEIVDENNNSTGTSDDDEEDNLTPENSDLIEVLWKQDVDLGFVLPQTENVEKKVKPNDEEEIEKLQALLEVKGDEFEKEPKVQDEWAGLNVTIDSETGEYITLPPLQLDESLLDEVLQNASFDLDADEDSDTLDETKSLSSAASITTELSDLSSTLDSELLKLEAEEKNNLSGATTSSGVSETNSNGNLDDSDTVGLVDLLCDMMIQSSSNPFQHPRAAPSYGHGMNSFRNTTYHHQSRVPLNRTMSVEQRWNDLTTLLSFPPGMGVGMGEMGPPNSHYASHPHYPHHYQSAAAAAAASMQPQHAQFPHHHPHHSVLHHNASLVDIGASQPHYGPNLGSAVATSMHLTNSSSESDGATGYKMDHDNMMYYSNTSSEMNHTNDGFLNSFLNDEDLQIMDMAVNDSMYTMQLLDRNSTSNNSSVLGSSASAASHGNGGVISSPMQTNLGQLGSLASSHGDRLDASSDSAVSSMGSERVPSLSDGEWGDAGSDSAQEYHSYHHSRMGADGTRQPPVAQKKHQMYGKRYFQEQATIPSLPTQQAATSAVQSEQLTNGPLKYEFDPYSMQQPPIITPHTNLEGAVGPVNKLNESEVKYSCSVDFTRHSRQMQDLVSHNHSYTLPQGSGATPRPQARDKRQKKIEEEHLTRDEKKARENKIPMTVHEIINLPMDEFNERLSKYDLSEVQLSLIRDIRRRGKNKVAAQNCRKRKLDQILTLADEVKEVRRRKERLLNEREMALAEKKSIMDKFSALYRHVFHYLRDPDGNPYSPAHYSLQLAADGNVYVLPRDNKDNSSSHHNQQGSSSNHHHHHHHHQKE